MKNNEAIKYLMYSKDLLSDYIDDEKIYEPYLKAIDKGIEAINDSEITREKGEQEIFYLFDGIAKELHPLCANDLFEALNEGFSMDIGYSVAPLDENDLKNYVEEGWKVLI